MALPGWTKKCLITVAANKITSTTTNQVLLFTAGHFNSEMLTAGGSNACASDGSDVRFSLDSSADNLLAFDLIKCSLSASPSSSQFVVAVKFPTITANASFTFYCHWGNSGASKPAKDSLIGSGSCWSMFYGVLPLSENPAQFTTSATKWKCFSDSTGRYAAGSLVSAATQVSGAIPGLSALSVGTTGGVQIPEVAATNRGGFQVAMIAYIPAFTGYYFSQSTSITDGFSFDAGIPKVQYTGNWSYNFTPEVNKWGLLRATQEGGTFYISYGNVLSASLAWAGPFTTLQYIGGGAGALPMYCNLFMLNQFSTVPDTFFTNLLNAINNNGSLASAGTIESASVSSSLTFTGLATSSEVRIYTAGTTTELTGVENTTSAGTFTYSYSTGGNVDIQIFHLQYQPIRYTNFTLGATAVTIPIQQQIDRNYYNP